MDVTIPSELRTFVEQQIASGKYQTEDEVICAALRLLREVNQRNDTLREELQCGVADLDGGYGREAAEVFRELRKRVSEWNG